MKWLTDTNVLLALAEEYCRPFGRSPKVVMDACLAAFAVAGGYRLVTLDRAFGEFHGLSWVIPPA